MHQVSPQMSENTTNQNAPTEAKESQSHDATSRLNVEKQMTPRTVSTDDDDSARLQEIENIVAMIENESDNDDAASTNPKTEMNENKNGNINNNARASGNEDMIDGNSSEYDIIEPTSEDVFEIEDYYCASPWETLISEIEKTLKQWNLHNGNEIWDENKNESLNKQFDRGVLSKDIKTGPYHYVLEYHDYSKEIGSMTIPPHFGKFFVF